MEKINSIYGIVHHHPHTRASSHHIGPGTRASISLAYSEGFSEDPLFHLSRDCLNEKVGRQRNPEWQNEILEDRIKHVDEMDRSTCSKWNASLACATYTPELHNRGVDSCSLRCLGTSHDHLFCLARKHPYKLWEDIVDFFISLLHKPENLSICRPSAELVDSTPTYF